MSEICPQILLMNRTIFTVNRHYLPNNIMAYF